MSHRNAVLHRWEDIALERVGERLSRRFVTGERTMLAQVFLETGCQVPIHTHENEHISYVLKGAIRFWVGDQERQEFDVAAGEVLHIPSGVPHRAQVLEDSLVADVFTPPRQDWIDKTDDYLPR